MRIPRIAGSTYRYITLIALIAVTTIVVTGAAVRLTGSGLGCDNWPACTENTFVSGTGLHQQIEQINRLFTGIVSVAVIVAVLGSLARVPRRRDLLWWSTGLVAGIIAQIVLGGFTVLFHLWPPLVMGHFVLSAILVWNAVVLHHRAGHPDTPGVLMVPPNVAKVSRAAVASAGLVLIAGTVVTGTGPHGGDERVDRLPFIIEDVARVHSLLAWIMLGLLVATLGLAYRSGASARLRRRGAAVCALIVAQGALGYTQYFLGVPPALVLLHIAGAAAVWIAVLSLHLSLTNHPEHGEMGATGEHGHVTSSQP
ncbi:MAG: COX15/CtaA family protein [Actinomycetes bacterium]